jgi:hypothetical protein
MKTYGEVKVLLHALLTLTLDGGEWSALPPRESPQYQIVKCLCGPHGQSGNSSKEESLPLLGIETDSPAPMQITVLTELFLLNKGTATLEKINTSNDRASTY